MAQISTSMLIVAKSLFMCPKGLIMSPVFSSGRRDFGEFSVYKPSNTASASTKTMNSEGMDQNLS